MTIENETQAFYQLIYLCIWNKEDGTLYPFRHLRAGHIIAQWGIDDKSGTFYINEAAKGLRNDWNHVIWAAAQKITPRIATHIFILCADIISCGEPMTDRDRKIMKKMSEQLCIPEPEYTATLRFCAIRSTAVNVNLQHGVAKFP